jgi:NADH-quinone oxidoreductase subunit N
MMLWGVALIAAATGTLDYAQLPQAVATALEGPNWVSVGMALVLASVAFKLGIFPFGYYLPAVYERCGYAGLGFLATLGKAGAVIALIGLVQGPFIGFWRQIVPIFGVLAILTLIWGVFGALRQTDIKRLLALSGVVHAGFILGAVSLGISNPAFMQTAWFYLVAYVLALGLIAMVLGLSASGSNAIDALRNTYARNPYLGIAGVVGFASLAGLPPLVGFMAKFFVFLRAVQSGSWGLVWVMIFASVVGLYYYFKVVLTLIGRAELIETEMPIAGVRITIPRTAAVVVGALMLAIVLLGVCPGLVPTGI